MIYNSAIPHLEAIVPKRADRRASLLLIVGALTLTGFGFCWLECVYLLGFVTRDLGLADVVIPGRWLTGVRGIRSKQALIL
jgi:hypothetical protein